MNKNLDELEFCLFRDYIEKKYGILIPDEKIYLIESRLSKFLSETKSYNFKDLYNLSINNNNNNLEEKIIDAITPSETSFFRDEYIFNILEDIYMPLFIDKINKNKKIKIWSTATSTGQEAYSIAMFINNYLNKNNINLDLNNFEILATDISKHALEIAKNGRYDAISIMRSLSTKYRDDYFIKEEFQDNSFSWVINKKLRDIIDFRQFNLLNDFLDIKDFDAVFCLNILNYFKDESKFILINKFKDILNKGGVLFVGKKDINKDIGNILKEVNYKNLIYYVKEELL